MDTIDYQYEDMDITNTNGHRGTPMSNHGQQSTPNEHRKTQMSTDANEQQWTNEHQWTPMDTDGRQLKPMNINEHQWTPIHQASGPMRQKSSFDLPLFIPLLRQFRSQFNRFKLGRKPCNKKKQQKIKNAGREHHFQASCLIWPFSD